MVEVRDLRGAFRALDDDKWLQLDTYFRLLVDWNARVNLTAITSPVEVYVKHFYDSLLLTQMVDVPWFSASERVADVGTGAGFPGLVLAIAAPKKQFVLMDSLGKRLKFLETVQVELGLDNVELVHGRAEDLAKEQAYRERFHLVVSRAVAKLNVLAELTLPLLRVDGWFVAYKGPSAAAELLEAKRAIHVLGGAEEAIVTHNLLEGMGERKLVPIRKVRSTPRQYPRKAGAPQKNPL